MVKCMKIKNNYYKKGFTLVELLCSITLLLSVITFIGANTKVFLNIMNYVDYKMCDNCIINFINVAKQYCRNNKCVGKINLIENGNRMVFCSGGKNIKEYKLPNKFYISSLNVLEININTKGLIQNACTIEYKDRKWKIHTLTICVGTGHAQIK